MTKCTSTIIYLLCLTFSATAQEVLHWDEYFKLIHKADTLYQNKRFQESAEMYSSAFLFNQQSFSEGDRFNSARAWAKAGQPDSAISNLKLEGKIGFYHLERLKKEIAFKTLKNRNDWKGVVDNVKSNQRAQNKKLGKLKTVKPKLEKILVLDQKYRKEYNDKLQTSGANAKELKKIFQLMRRTDEKNVKYVSKILNKHGWLDYNIIGFDAAAALFLVIQHADSATQENYLPLLQQAVKEKKAFGSDLALLEDRVLIKRGQKQVYGSQIQCDSTGKKCWILPIADERNVDKRREEVGLQPLEEYVKYWNIIYRRPD